MYDICIIGAGTSGLMASISAASYGAKVIVLESNKKVGKKLRLTGGGRCNVTNNRPVEDIINHIPHNGKFLYSSLSKFNNYDIINFFEENDVALKEEDHGRIFPISNSSKTIVNTLYQKALELNVEFQLETLVKTINKNNDSFSIITENKIIQAKKVIVSTGGKSYTYTGSTGFGYKIAKKFGHKVTELFPAEAPLIASDSFIKERKLQGISLKNSTIQIFDENKNLKISHTLDVLFTHFGLSGPAALRCSETVYHLLKKQKSVYITIDCYPNLEYIDLEKELKNYILNNPKQQLATMLNHYLQERLANVVLTNLKLNSKQQLAQLKNNTLIDIINQIKNFPLHIINTWPLEKAFVTGGGIDLTNINPSTLESKITPNLYFTGEVLDINGYTGGFNITAAFSTGYTAGMEAALSLY